MRKNTIVTLCTLASIASIVVGFALMFAGVFVKRTSEWGEAASGFTAQAILIAGGLIALAICSSSGRD